MANKTKTAPKKSDAPKTDPRAEELIAKWQKRINSARKNQEPVFKRARENYEIYYAQIPKDEVPEDKWKSNVFLPLLPGKARDAKAKLCVIDPKFRATPVDSFTVNDNGELEYDTDALLASLKVSKKLNKELTSGTRPGALSPRVAFDYSQTDAIVAGWGVALAPLNVYEKKYKTHKPLLDGEGNDTAYVDKTSVDTTTILRVGTELKPLDIFKVFISPEAHSFEESPWTIIERDETYDALQKENHDLGEHVYILPDSLKKAKGSAVKNDYSDVRESALGLANDFAARKDETITKFRVYDCYDDEEGRFYTFIVAGVEEATKGWLMARDMENPYYHGLTPTVSFYAKRRPHSPWGESFYDISRDIQRAYNAAYNEFRDNQRVASESMVVEDVNAKVKGSSYKVAPGNTIKYDSLNGEKPEPFKLIDPNPNTFSTVMTMLEKNAENGTMAQYNSGQVDSSMDKTAGTRGGIAMMIEMANDRLSEMYRNLKLSLERYGFIALSNAQQYQNYIEVLNTPSQSARAQADIKSGKPVNAEYITPTELQRLYDITIDDESMLPMTKTERRQVFKEFIDTLVALQASSIKQAETFDTPEDIMRLDYADISKAIGESYAELDAPAFIKAAWTREDMEQKKLADATATQKATEAAGQIAQSATPHADVSQNNGQIQVERQKRELLSVDKMPADVQNAIIESYGYPASQLLTESAKAEIATSKSTQLDAEVKAEMVAKAKSGKIDPEQLSKYIKK